MIQKRLAVLFLALVVPAAAIIVTMRSMGEEGPPPGAVEPAFAFYTRSHSASYGGIDRWAFPGMRADAVTALLGRDGYTCGQPKALTEDGAGTLQARECTKKMRWPVPRTLSIRVTTDQGMRDRLVGAVGASSVDRDSLGIIKRSTVFLRKIRWIEPERLDVKGVEIATLDMLEALAVDALTVGGWVGSCGDDRASPQCAHLARVRRESGFPPVPSKGVAIGNAMGIHAAMEHIRFLPMAVRTADRKPMDSLLVRVADEKMWLDFVGRDLTGRELTVSVALDSEGGVPVQMVVGSGEDSKVLALSGKPRLANDGAMIFLVPEAGTEPYRPAIWLDLPNKNYPGTYERIAGALSGVEPAFIPHFLKAAVAATSTDDLPEENLGLYPALRTIEHRADVLRAAQTTRWLPGEEGGRLIRQAYQDEPETRAAWALARCESTGAQSGIVGDCWLRFKVVDPDAADLLRREAAELQLQYSALAPTHPIKLRLKRLGDALSRD